jgi:hypothetical protein
MIWSIIGICLLFFASREILLGLLIIIKKAEVDTPSHDFFDFLIAKSRKGFRIFLCNSLKLKALSWKTTFGPILLIDKLWWLRLTEDQKKSVILWFSLAQEKSLFFERVFGLSPPSKIDRDCLIEGVELAVLLSIIDSLKKSSFSLMNEPLSSLLSGLSLYSGIQYESSKKIETRLQKAVISFETLNR